MNSLKLCKPTGEPLVVYVDATGTVIMKNPDGTIYTGAVENCCCGATSALGAVSGTYINGTDVRLGTNPYLENVLLDGADSFNTLFDNQTRYTVRTGSAATTAQGWFDMFPTASLPIHLRQTSTIAPTNFGEIAIDDSDSSWFRHWKGADRAGFDIGNTTKAVMFTDTGGVVDTFKIENGDHFIEGLPTTTDVTHYVAIDPLTKIISEQAVLPAENLAKEVIVDLNGDDLTAQVGTRHLPFQTIQAAIDAATSGGTIVIKPGLHNITSTINVNKGLTFVIEGGAKVIGSVGTLVFDVTAPELVKFIGNGIIVATGDARGIYATALSSNIVLEDIGLKGDRDLVAINGTSYFQNVRLEMTNTGLSTVTVSIVSGSPTLQVMNVVATHAVQPVTLVGSVLTNPSFKVV